MFMKFLYFLTTDTPIEMDKKIKGKEERRNGGVKKKRERNKRREEP